MANGLADDNAVANASSAALVLDLDAFQRAVFPVAGAEGAFMRLNACWALAVVCQTMLSVACLLSAVQRATLATAGASRYSLVIRHPITVWLAYILPPALLGGWAIQLAPFEPGGCWVYGLGVLLIGLPIMLGGF